MPYRARALVLLALACLGASNAGAQERRLAFFAGRVLSDPSERPINGAVISVPALKLEAISDSSGRFRIPGIAVGRQLVTVKRLGFQPFTMPFTFTPSDSLDADILLTPNPTELERVSVVGETYKGRALHDFERRRISEAGDFLTEKDLATSARMPEILRRLPGVTLKQSARGETHLVAGRGNGQRIGAAPCFVSVNIDGTWVYDGKSWQIPYDVNSIPREHIAAIEYYRGMASIPVEFRGGFSQSCGVLVIWTK